jgi:serine protease Do
MGYRCHDLQKDRIGAESLWFFFPLSDSCVCARGVMSMHRFLLIRSAVASLLLMAGSLGNLSDSRAADLPVRPIAEGRVPSVHAGSSARYSPVANVVRKVKEAVVNIHSERTVRAGGVDELFNLTPSQNRINGMGTGILIDPRGYIVTNQHVVDEVSLLRVRLADGTTLPARVLAREVESDLALIKVNPKQPLPIMSLGTVRDLEVGETVVAVGNAYGYDHTVTVGIVSAIGRDVSLNKDIRYRGLIQTDAAINPGNSGGPLINLDGDLVGVNVAIRAGAQGIGFAIPVDSMIRVAGKMLATVRQSNGVATVGLELRDELYPEARAAGASLASTRKVVIERVSGSAERAGLRKGDVLVQMGDVKISSTLDVERGLLERESGTRVEVVVRRGDRESAIGLARQEQFVRQLTLEAVPNTTTAVAASSTPEGNAAQIWRQLGVNLQTLTNVAEVTRAFPQLHGGLLISEVRDGSPAARAGLRQGDILIGLHQWEILSLDNVLYVLNHADRHSFSPLRFYILRAGQIHRGTLNID